MSDTTEVVLAGVRDTPLSVDELVQAVRHPQAGAVVTFIGYVRDHDHGSSVEILEYSCHPSASEVAAALVARLASESSEPNEPSEGGRGGVVRVGVVHRVGRLEVGDVAVVAAVSAHHRAEAFDVCHRLIDEFKQSVPIWKHQVFTDGSDEWVGLP